MKLIPKAKIMNEEEIGRTIKRLSFEILERGLALASMRNKRELCLVGIYTRGAYLARRIAAEIKEREKINLDIGFLDITLYRDDFADVASQPVVKKTDVSFDISNKRIVLIDDVLFTGRTIRAALDAIIDFGRPQKIELCVLIDRGHRELPIRPDYIGKNIPTSLSERVEVMLKEVDGVDEVRVYPVKYSAKGGI